MFRDPIEDLRQGVVGTFAPLASPALPDSYAGHIHLGADGLEIAVVASKKEDPTAVWAEDPSLHSVLAGATEAGSILMPVTHWRRSTTRGDLVVQVVRWYGSTILVDVETDQIDGDTVSSVSLHYYGLGSWSAAAGTSEEPIVENGNIVGWRMEVRDQPEQTIELDDGFALSLGTKWTFGGDSDRRSMATPLTVKVTSRTRRSVDEHLLRLDAVHALLSLAHKKTVTATHGYAQLDSASRSRARLWNETMMDSSAVPGPNDFPVFKLAHLNELDGLAAWIRMCLNHARAVDPIVQHRLLTNQRPEARLLSTAAALEYWDAAHSRTHEWAGGHKFFAPHRVATTVAAGFDSWVGGTERWADLFSDTYNQLKHEPVTIDTRLANAVEVAGRWLLTASILDECSERDATSEYMFDRGLAYPTGNAIREVFGARSVPKERKPKGPRKKPRPAESARTEGELN